MFRKYRHKESGEVVEALFRRITQPRNDGTIALYGWWQVRSLISKQLNYPSRYVFFRELIESKDFTQQYESVE